MTRSVEQVRAMIADGEVPSRAGLRAALEEGGVEVVAEAGRTGEAVERARTARPDVSLVAARLPDDALAAVRGILAHAPRGAVIVLADEPATGEAFAALMAGASGYVHGDVQPERLPDVVRAVAAGEAAVPRALVAPLLRELRILRGSLRQRLEAERDVRLTDREWEVLSMLDAGLTTLEIAGRLELSPVTVRRHVGRLLAQLRVPDRAAALSVLRGAMRVPTS